LDKTSNETLDWTGNGGQGFMTGLEIEVMGFYDWSGNGHDWSGNRGIILKS